MDTISGGQLAAQALIDRNIDTIFTLSGGHITPIYQYLEDSDIKLYDTRHEQAAVFMAEAYGRINRKPGVCMVTAGPGFTNALTGIANAFQANSPVLLISGCVGIDNCEKLDLQDMYQAPVISPMVKKAFVCQNVERIPEYIDMALRTVMSGRPGPVYLELPVDILNAQCNPATVPQLNTLPESHAVDLDQAAQMVEMLQAAKKPMIIAGSGAWYSGAEAELTEFAEKVGAPIFTVTMGRGILPDTHPYCFESGVGTRPGATLFAQSDADLIILLGTRLSLFFLFGQLIDQNAKIIQVDIHAEELGRNRSADLPINCDIKALIKQVNKIVDEKGAAEEMKAAYAEWIETLRMTDQSAKTMMQESWDSEAEPILPLRLANEVNKFMNNKDDFVVADGGDTQVWMAMTRTVEKPAHYLDSGLYGCLGVGLPFANACKYLNPDSRVCLIIGDGSTGFNFMEFEIAIRKKLPIVVVIANDQGWGMIRHSQVLRIGHAIPDGTWIGEVPYHKLVEDLGGKGFLVTKPDDIQPALEEAFASGKTCCINVMVDPDTISPGSIALANIGASKAY